MNCFRWNFIGRIIVSNEELIDSGAARDRIFGLSLGTLSRIATSGVFQSRKSIQ
jgi:hypothetical protein